MFGRKRHDGEPCSSCDRPVREGEKICRCGAATRFMDFKERAAYEVEQYRRAREAGAR